MTDERRRAQRVRADWAAEFRVGADDVWRECRVIDVSFDGAALELDGVTTVEGLHGPIELRISSVAGDTAGAAGAAGAAGIALQAVLRRSVQLEARVIAGVEFAGLRAEERSLLQLLVGLRSIE